MKPLTPRAWAGVAAGLLAAFALLVAFWHPAGEEAGQSAQEAAPDSPLVLHWRQGSSQQYRVEIASTFRMQTAGAETSRPGQSIAILLDATLDFATLETGPSHALVGMRLLSPALQVSGVSDPATNRSLGTPFRVRFAPDGMPTAFEFPAELIQEHRDVIENLVRTFQVTVRPGSAWTAQEPSANGVYEAAYVRAGVARLQKTKRRFVAAAKAPAGAVPEIASKEAIGLDARRDWIVSMQVDETVRSGDATGLTVDIVNHASLLQRPDAVAQTPGSSEAWRFVAAAPSRGAAPAAAASAPARSLAEARQQLRSDVAALDAAREGRSVWIHRLRDLLRSDGKLPFELLEVMRAQPLGDRTRADLYLAFELAGTGPSQAALRSVIDGGGWTLADHKRAVIALGGVSAPTADSIGALWRLARGADSSSDSRQLAGTATLALGSAGSRLVAARDDRYPALRTDLLNGALGGIDAPQRALFVHALGNTGDASLAREIVPMLRDAEPAVRSAAAQSLGGLGVDAVAEELLARLAQEQTVTVRTALAEALVSWSSPTPAAMALIRAAVPAEREEGARLAMAQILGKSLASYPENRAVLQALLRTEASEQIRRRVAEMLAAGR